MVSGWDGEDLKVVDTATRHPKWVRVEPGTVIPAGQPYRVEFENTDGITAHECTPVEPRTVDPHYGPWFIDSTWSPPLELPTEPTWGIAVYPSGIKAGRISKVDGHNSANFLYIEGTGSCHIPLDFIPLAPEQVARIEAHR